jgi:MarR family transcriptional regulator, transcriptional regulator for hemolysin
LETIMTGFDPWESIGFHCSLTYRSFIRALEKRLGKTGISPAQFVALAHLTAFGAMPQAELAARLSTSPVSVARLIDRMERDGWVARKPIAEDRRIKQVVPTAQAEAVWSELADDARELVEQAHRGITDKELDMAKKTLRRIRDNLET